MDTTAQQLEQRELLTVFFDLLEDTNQTPEFDFRSVDRFFSTGDLTYFSGETNWGGRELWRTDKTQAGTQLVRDIWRGAGSSNPQPLANLDGRLLFEATDPVHGTELWITDEAGTGASLVKDQSPGREGSFFQSGVVWEDGFVFSAHDSALQTRQLFRTDGTSNGTGLWFDESSMPSNFAALTASRVLAATSQGVFLTVQRSNSVELFRSDGTAAGTESLGEFRFISASVVFQDQLAFVVIDGGVGTSLWRTDGTPAGTEQVQFLGTQASTSVRLTAADDVLIVEDTTNGGLWTTDLSPQGTQRRFDSWNSIIRAAGDALYYFARTSEGRDVLHRTNRSFSNDTEIPLPDDFHQKLLSNVFSNEDSHIYQFSVSAHSELWVLDAQGFRNLTQFNTAKIIQVRTDGTTAFIFHWQDPSQDILLSVSEGQVSGIRNLGRIQTRTGDARPATSIQGGRGLLFSSAQRTDVLNISSPVAWYSDGTESGTWPLVFESNIVPAGQPLNAVQIGDTVLFSHKVLFTDGVSAVGLQLFHLDLSTRHATVIPRMVAVEKLPIAILGDSAFVVLEPSPPVTGDQYPSGHLVRVRQDGSAEIVLGEQVGFPRSLLEVVSLNGMLYFLAWDDLNGLALWRSDGTLPGTQLVRSLSTQPIVVDSLHMEAGTNRLYLAFERSASNTSVVWTSDGTAAGTRPVDGPLSDGSVRIPGSTFNGGSPFLVAGDRCFFLGYNNDLGYELWATDGSGAGTQVITEQFTPGGHFSIPTAVQVMSDSVVFVHASRIYRTDGTANGTRLASSVNADDLPSVVFDRLFFSAFSNGVTVLWTSDGTIEGTVPLTDETGQSVLPRYSPPIPFRMAQSIVGGVVYVGDGGLVGTEPFHLSAPAVTQVPLPARIHRTITGALFGFSWKNVWGAVGYEVRLSSAFSETVVTQFRDDGLDVAALSSTLSTGAYFVELRAISADGSMTEWSDRRSFVIGELPAVAGLPSETTNPQPVVRVVSPETAVSTTIWVGDVRANTRVALIELSNSGVDPLAVSAQLPPLAPSLYGIWVRSRLADGSITAWTPRQLMNVLLPAPEVISVTSSEFAGRIRIDWQAVSGASGYELEIISTTGSTPKRSIRLDNPGTLSLSVALPGDRYAIRVRALQGAFPRSQWSPTELVLLKSRPTVLADTGGISWKGVFAVSGYRLTIRNLQTGAVLVNRVLPPSVLAYRDLPRGRFTATVVSLYEDQSAAGPASVLTFELFRAAVTPILTFASTADATPIVRWDAASGAASYEVQITTRSGNLQYRQSGIASLSHRVSLPLPAGEYRVWVRASFPDGSRSLWGAGRALRIGAPVTVSYRAGTLTWTTANEATHYELWINYDGGLRAAQARIIHEEFLVETRFDFPANLPKGRYSVWIRAFRAESSDRYFAQWSSVLRFDV